MNTNTGELYTNPIEIEKAKKRGEPLVEISPEAAQRIRCAYVAQKRDKARKAKARRAKRAQIQKASRRKNRR